MMVATETNKTHVKVNPSAYTVEVPNAENDPFYSESNMRYLDQQIADYKTGRMKFVKHPLIEE